MYLQENIHQTGQIIWVHLRKGNYCPAEIFWIIYIGQYTPHDRQRYIELKAAWFAEH